jgi:hypothetical protein
MLNSANGFIWSDEDRKWSDEDRKWSDEDEKNVVMEKSRIEHDLVSRDSQVNI